MDTKHLSIEILQGDDEIHRFMQWRKGDGSPEIISDLKDTIGGVQAETVWVFVAKIGSQWAGSIKLQRFHEDIELADGQKRAYLGALEVEIEFRRRGIGRALTERALREAKKRGFIEVTLNVEPTNQAALDLYLAMGFQKFKTTFLHWQGEKVEAESQILSLNARAGEGT